MTDLVKNKYFIKEQEEEIKAQVYEPIVPVDSVEVDTAPRIEPIKGMTSIIIPAFLNSYPLFHMTGNCIGSIREHTDKEKTPYEIILVLNGGGIKIDKLEDTYADKVIVEEEKLGYTKAVNKGIRVASGEFIAIVTNDVQVFDGWLDDLQQVLTDTDLELVMATPMYGMAWARAVEARALAMKCEGFPVEETFSDFNDFSCVLTRKQLFNELGLFDERYFMHCQDIDFLRKMKKTGKKFASTKRVNTTHIINASFVELPNMGEIMDEDKKKLFEVWGE